MSGVSDNGAPSSSMRRNGWMQRLRALRNIPPMLTMVWASGTAVVVSCACLHLAAAVIPLGMLSVSRMIIDAVVAATTGTHQPLPRGFWWIVSLEFALAVLASVLSRAIGFCESLFADRFTRYVSIRVMEHASTLDLASYENPEFYDKLERARRQATERIGMVRDAGMVLQQAITAATLSAAIFVYSPWLLILLIGCLAPAFLGETHFAFLGYSLSFGQACVRRQMDYYRELGASKESAKELKLFGLAPFFVRRYSDLSDRIYDENRALARRRLFVGAFLSILSSAGYYAAYTYVIFRTVKGHQSVGTMTFLAGSIAATSTNIQNVFSSFSSIADQALFLTDLREFFAFRPPSRPAAPAVVAPRRIQSGFEMRNVTFAYPGTSRIVLDRLNMRWELNERIALVGGNGQGKTTLVKLLTRLYEPTGGKILLDGTDLRDYDIEDLYNQIGVVCQDFMRYEMPAAENIGIGRIAERNNSEKLRSAARKSGADAVIGRLPNGYQQMLGRRFEGGVDLSGGEWQKMALARAYMRDAQILILDEPTAALDAKSEHEVFQRFIDLIGGKMALFISHRFSTVRMADRILVLDDGRIAEEGSHARLMKLGRRYFGMFELQAAKYR